MGDPDQTTGSAAPDAPRATAGECPGGGCGEDLPRWLARRLQNPPPRRRPCAPELNYGRHRMPPLPDTRQAAVLVLLYPRAGDWTIPLTLRPRTLSIHAGQVSLPGGRVHAGESMEQAALREFAEELGVTASGCVSLGRLSPVFIYGSNHFVLPCVAAVAARPDFQPNTAEVSRVIELPLSALLNPRLRGWHWIRRRQVRFRAPHIQWRGARIWGATHLMLAELGAFLEEWRA